MSIFISLSEAIVGFEIDCNARKLSPHTINDYFVALNKFINFIGTDTLIKDITTQQISEFLASFPHLSNKTIYNYHISLSSLWSFLLRNDLADSHIIRRIPRPKPEIKEIVPFSESEVRSILASLKHSKTFARTGNRNQKFSLHPCTVQRNKSILLLLIDTGIRREELCNAQIKDYSARHTSLQIMGKGAKQRTIYLSASTHMGLWKYLRMRPESLNHHPLYATRTNGYITTRNLDKILTTIGNRAGVPKVHPHRFRHTFAINYLRNGGDVYTLQKILGHSTLNMVSRYLAIAETDVKTAHRLASPVDHWGL
ncbi:MAG: tyrosine-type recombinase/integrase [Anaerolineaceae bacterium]|nr:tyrosine-type recombinase/integrase [Anaerolineaceae bacterium]